MENMQIKTIQQNNLYNPIRFCSNPISTPVESKEIENTKEDKQKKNKNLNKILLIGTGLSAIAIAGILIAKGRGKTPIKPPSVSNTPNIVPPTPTHIPTASGSVIPEVITDIRKLLSKEDLPKFEAELKKLQSNSNYRLITKNNQSNFKKLQQILAVEKAQIKGEISKFPKALISIPDNIAKLTALILNSQHSSIKYNKGFMEEFFTILENSSSKSKFDFENFQTRTFLNIENLSELIADVKAKGNEEYYSKLMKFVKNEDNSHKITMLLNDYNASKLEIPNDAKMGLNLPSHFNEELGAKDYETYLSNQAVNKLGKIREAISKYAEVDNASSTYFINKILLNQPDKTIFIIGEDEKPVSKVIEILRNNSNTYLDDFACADTIGETLKQLAKKGEEAQSRFTRTGLKTLLNIKGIEKLLSKDADLTKAENKALREFIETEAKKQNIIPACSVKENIHPDLVENNSNILFNTDKAKNLYEKMAESFKKNNLSACNPEQITRFERLYTRFLAEERGSIGDIDWGIPNGILLHGKSEVANNQFANAIKSLDANHVIITHNPQKPLETIGAIIDTAEKAEKIFKETRKRTILLVENLDEMLSDYSTIERRDMIGRFKGFVEHISKDYHMTLVMKTTKPLEDFEPASIGDHRFELKVAVDK
jgi:hypothetical protein